MFTRNFMPRVSEILGGKHVRQDIISLWMIESTSDIHLIFGHDIMNLSLIMVNSNVDYLDEILFGTEVTVTTEVKSIGNSSFVLHQNLYQDERHCVSGLITLIHFDYSTHERQPVPDDVRRQLERHLTGDRDSL